MAERTAVRDDVHVAGADVRGPVVVLLDGFVEAGELRFELGPAGVEPLDLGLGGGERREALMQERRIRRYGGIFGGALARGEIGLGPGPIPKLGAELPTHEAELGVVRRVAQRLFSHGEGLGGAA